MDIFMYPQFRGVRVCVYNERLRRGIYDFVGSVNHRRRDGGGGPRAPVTTSIRAHPTPQTGLCSTGGGRLLKRFYTAFI